MSKVKLFAFDIDGVLTDGRLYYSAQGEETGLKVFNAQDGLGMSLLKKAGIKVAVISGRAASATRQRMKDLGVDFVILGKTDKLSAINELAQESGLAAAQIAYMGDDLIDLKAMEHVGVAYAPANAVSQVKLAAGYVCARNGGEGAAREAIEHLFEQQGIDPVSVLVGEVVQ